MYEQELVENVCTLCVSSMGFHNQVHHKCSVCGGANVVRKVMVDGCLPDKMFCSVCWKKHRGEEIRRGYSRRTSTQSLS